MIPLVNKYLSWELIIRLSNVTGCFMLQFSLGKIFWGIVIVLMFLLGCYWCVTAYQAWMDQPVLTTITTTALPIEQVNTLRKSPIITI